MAHFIITKVNSEEVENLMWGVFLIYERKERNWICLHIYLGTHRISFFRKWCIVGSFFPFIASTHDKESIRVKEENPADIFFN